MFCVQIAGHADGYSTRIRVRKGVVVVGLQEDERPVRPLADAEHTKGCSLTSGEPDRWGEFRPRKEWATILHGAFTFEMKKFKTFKSNLMDCVTIMLLYTYHGLTAGVLEQAYKAI